MRNTVLHIQAKVHPATTSISVKFRGMKEDTLISIEARSGQNYLINFLPCIFNFMSYVFNFMVERINFMACVFNFLIGPINFMLHAFNYMVCRIILCQIYLIL